MNSNRKASKVIEIYDDLSPYVSLRGYIRLDDNWVTKYDKVLYNIDNEPYKVLDFAEIQLNTLINPEIAPHFSGHKNCKFSCVKLDQPITIDTLLYTSSN